ncbi:MAG: hypothetical protein JWM58_4144 [Rhizobium sp.]|nr:hypothetical protein [Rhizobium sp.]
MLLGNDWLKFELDEESALDIGSMKVDGVEMAPGDAVPDDGDPRILRAVGGFLFTCGPDHIRHPEPVETMPAKLYPLHGSMSGTKPHITGETKTADFHEVTASIKVTVAQGGEAEIVRSWRFDLVTGDVSLEDRLINIGKSAFPPMLMYHMNINTHLFDDRTTLAGPSFEGGNIHWRIGDGDGHVFCNPAVAEDDKVTVRLGAIEAIGGKSLNVWYGADSIPHLQMWRNEAGHCNVLGIEPVTHPWKKRHELDAMGLMSPLAAGAFRIYRMGFAFR